jgi:hypothetical protein
VGEALVGERRRARPSHVSGFRLHAAVVALVCGCGGGKPAKDVPIPAAPASASVGPPPSPPPPRVSAREKKLIARMLKKVSAVRGLEAKREVPGATLAREELIARVKAHVAREVPREAIRREGLVLQLLGLIPTKFDYEAETFALLEAQLAATTSPPTGPCILQAISMKTTPTPPSRTSSSTHFRIITTT